jgi:hypothetical protein
LPSGNVFRTGGKTLKSISGYDLTMVICVSEGALGDVLKKIPHRLLVFTIGKIVHPVWKRRILMYVRWNRRKRFKPGWREKEGDYLSAVLVKSSRIEGVPRQKVIKWLGSISEDSLQHISIRREFWVTVEKNLALVELSAEESHKVIASIGKVVPKPSEKELEKDHADRIRRLKEIWERLSRKL